MQGVFEVKRLIWLLALVSSVSMAQVVPTMLTRALSKADCLNQDSIQTLAQGGKISVPTGNASVTTLTASGGSGTVTTLSCADTAPQGQVNISAQIDASDLLSGPSVSFLLPESACTTEAGAKTADNGYNYLCIYNKTNTKLVAQITYQYDTKPNNISISSFSAGNGRITIHINDPKSGKNDYKPNYRVCYGKDKAAIQKIKDDQAGDCRDQQTKESRSSPILITGLENDTTYYFTAGVAGSQWDTVNSATPELSYGFGTAYNGAASPLSCTQTSANPASWILFLLLAIFLSRKTSPLAPFIFLLATPLFADLGQLNVGITGAPYRPALDSSTKSDGATAFPFYKCMLNDKLAPLMGLEVDVHLLDGFGSLQVGMGAAYTYAGGAALKVLNGQPTCEQTGDSAALHMLHFKPQITYILDNWVDQFPLAPYIRGGIVGVGYLFTYQGGLDKEGKAKPVGVVFGWEAAAGLMFMLDFLQPSVTESARANGAYDHVFLKAEAAYMPINNFYQNGLNFSPAWPTPSFPLMLTFGLVFEFK